MLTLGIDPGTASTGFGLVTERGSKLQFIDHGVIITTPEDSSQARIRKIYHSVKDLIKNYKPTYLAIERLFFGKNTKTAMMVAHARGIVLLAAAELKIPVAEYTPLEVKVAATGYGKADKRQVQQMVKVLLGLSFDPKPDDAADALAIAICHHHSHKMKYL